ncbi:hypothetical protein D3C79_48880 [compost metagenome]
MPAINDPLWDLLCLTQGDVAVTINEHRVSHGQASVYLNTLPKTMLIPAPDRAAMIEANTIVRVRHDPSHSGKVLDSWGATVEQAVQNALDTTLSIISKGVVVRSQDNLEVNHTALLQQLGGTCLHEVTLEFNPFKSLTWGICGTESLHRTVGDYIAFKREIQESVFQEDEHGPAEISQAMIVEMEAKASIIELYYYPTTTVGYYTEYGTNLAEMLEEALGCATTQRKLYE